MAEKIKNIFAQFDTTLVHATGFRIRADELFEGDIAKMLELSFQEAEITGDPDHTRWAQGSYKYWLNQESKLKE